MISLEFIKIPIPFFSLKINAYYLLFLKNKKSYKYGVTHTYTYIDNIIKNTDIANNYIKYYRNMSAKICY